MHREPRQSPARLLAPLALVACGIAFVFILFTSGAGESDDSNGGERASETTQTTERARSKRRRPAARKATYTVRTGDTLGLIAEKTGLTVEKLQEINPELDPQALVAGQKIKLRE